MLEIHIQIAVTPVKPHGRLAMARVARLRVSSSARGNTLLSTLDGHWRRAVDLLELDKPDLRLDVLMVIFDGMSPGKNKGK